MQKAKFYKSNFLLAGYHCIADILKPSYNHENHFGLSIANSRSDKEGMYIESKEHAEALIEALKEAIATEVLLPEVVIYEMRSRGIRCR